MIMRTSIIGRLCAGSHMTRRTSVYGRCGSAVRVGHTGDVSADVLKVGHHGSNTSTSEAFLERVDPTYAVISVGEGNSYGHPHAETLEKLEAQGCKVCRTDTDGTVVVTSNGQRFLDGNGEVVCR